MVIEPGSLLPPVFLTAASAASVSTRAGYRKLTFAFSSIMMANDLQITLKQGDETTVLAVSGRVSVDSSPALRNRLLAVLKSVPIRSVIVDLTETPYIDCSGIATLIEALKVARNRNVSLGVRGLQGRIKNLFEISGVLRLFEGKAQTTALSSSKEF